MTYYCSECGEECQGKWENQGIGPYEFWGQKGNDVRMVFVSDCCSADLQDEDGNEVDAAEDERLNQADRIADDRRDRELEWDRAVGEN